MNVGDLVDQGFAEIKTGPFGTQLRASDYVATGRPVLNVKNVGFGDVRPWGFEYVDEVTASRLSSHILKPNDIVFGRKGAVERHAFITDKYDGAMQGSDCIRLRIADDSPIPARFITFALRTKQHQAWIQAFCSHGATMASLNQEIVRRIPLPKLDPPQIDLAVAVLQNFDSFLENNRRRIQVLEKMARAIYREWFVKFRYPGHEDVPMVDSALGPIPEGWDLSTCGDELRFIGGGTPSKKDPSYWDGGSVAWYTPSDLTKTRWRYASAPELRITQSGVAKSSARLFPAGSVMMTSRATLGVLAVATTEATTNQGFIVILPDSRWTSGFIYEWLASNAVELAALGTGATFKEITKGSFKKFPFIVPAQDVLDTYKATAEPLEAQIHNLENQTRQLTRLRDLLLPKLVTGEIDVSTLDLDSLTSIGSLGEAMEV
ncbi:restriction endonuclease subunit S [Corynebacterium sp. TAE3-ERU12]|uniref:restriction endonuclease subunit S n=1 Tax=Corynebacterium sp. TAE3-ERU12 TaxID=2849491 RepID=UPI001C4823AB|nr:restriction endonuclease subunit S [Corynebacterium sp. TAE3-ERU12]MBV7295731.1 restriction endonuclease subunit S [Corynebacterium sp. TAE3-ERU12]